MSPVRLTSQDAHEKVIRSGQKRTQRERIISYLESSPPRTRNEIAEETGIRLNCVCGAVFTAVASGLLIEVDERPDEYTGFNANPLTLPDQPRLM